MPPSESEELIRKQKNDWSCGNNGDCFLVRNLKIVEFILLSLSKQEVVFGERGKSQRQH